MAPIMSKKDKTYKFHNPTLESEAGNEIVPKAKGSIPRLAVLLGLLSPFYYELYQKCDGNRNVTKLSEEMNIELPQMRMYVDKLIKNGLVTIS